MEDKARHRTVWTVRKYENDQARAEDKPFAVDIFEGNLLLNEGITALLNLLIGGAETNFSQTNAYIGVGDSSTAAAASQTGLLGTNELYVQCESGYPSIASQTVTWRAEFAGSEAVFSWNEFTVANGAGSSADNLNRKVEAEGTKASGQTWTVDLSITFS